ncbi:LysR family transcriptional regulator [Acuticoccus sediminis]|uniref:LysR family transcriptional regulator n=1 Tax=Acuticoccus sediminis TaxID=2184697 RepID=A0A8B2P1I6_9HYPH|nr:LysR family transcriptional regulator [Acuticoccus sediminis]RAI02137.1 LysR family transcriptional regulator [Acuticoccus sediminis]
MIEQKLRKVDLNLLVVLRSLLATSSVGQTAKLLGMSQPATSRALASLRELFDDRLFVKSGSKMKPTPRAIELGEPLESLLSSVLRVLDPPAVFDPSTSQRRFRIASTDYGATVVLPQLAPRLFAAAPNMEVDFRPLAPNSFDELGSNDLDLVLYSDNPVPGALRAREIYRERFACLMRRGHPAEPRGRRLSLEAYLAHPHILVTVSGGRTGPVDRVLETLGRQRRIALVLPYFATAALTASTSDLILTMPARAAQAYADAVGLTLLAPPVELGDFGYRIVWHERVHDDPGHAWLRRLIADSFREDA